MLNLPIVDDTLALRIVGYGATDGGYIDNVFGPYRRHESAWAPTTHSRRVGATLDNAKYVEDDWNDADIWGVRGALKWDINDRLVSHPGRDLPGYGCRRRQFLRSLRG